MILVIDFFQPPYFHLVFQIYFHHHNTHNNPTSLHPHLYKYFIHTQYIFAKYKYRFTNNKKKYLCTREGRRPDGSVRLLRLFLLFFFDGVANVISTVRSFSVSICIEPLQTLFLRFSTFIKSLTVKKFIIKTNENKNNTHDGKIKKTIYTRKKRKLKR